MLVRRGRRLTGPISVLVCMVAFVGLTGQAFAHPSSEPREPQVVDHGSTQRSTEPRSSEISPPTETPPDDGIGILSALTCSQAYTPMYVCQDVNGQGLAVNSVTNTFGIQFGFTFTGYFYFRTTVDSPIFLLDRTYRSGVHFVQCNWRNYNGGECLQYTPPVSGFFYNGTVICTNVYHRPNSTAAIDVTGKACATVHS